MTDFSQPMTTYSDTTPLKRAIADVIDIIDPREVPGVAYFGLDNDPGKFDIVNWPSRKVEWLEDKLALINSALQSDWETDWTTVNVTTGHGKWFKPGDIIEIEGTEDGATTRHRVRVISISTDALTVAEDWDGAAPGNTVAASGSTIRLIGSARAEGADADYERALTKVSAPYNYTQILQDDLHITRTQQKITQYGKTGEWEYQAAKKMPELLRQMNRTLYRGVRKEVSGSAIRSMGGLDTFITTNTTDMSGGALTRKAVEDMVQDCWAAGGFPDMLVCNAWLKRKLSAMFEGFVRTERTEKTGGVQIDYLATEFGELGTLMDRWCPPEKLYVVESKYIGFIPYDAFFWEELGKGGDADKAQIVGEYTLIVKNNAAHGQLYNVSTTS